jgi:hypothetical protein
MKTEAITLVTGFKASNMDMEKDLLAMEGIGKDSIAKDFLMG